MEASSNPSFASCQLQQLQGSFLTLLKLSYPGEHLTHEMGVITVPASPEGVKILGDPLKHLAELKLRENLALTPTGQVWSGSQVDQRGDSEWVGGWGSQCCPHPPISHHLLGG